MKEEPISFEVAKLAKEKGFVEPTSSVYIGETLISNKVDSSGCDFTGYDHFVELDDFLENWNQPKWIYTKKLDGCFGCKLDNVKYFEAYSAPTQSFLAKWLREVHGIWVIVKFGYKIEYEVYLVNTGFVWNKTIPDLNDGLFCTYEQTLEEGLKQALTLI